MKRKLVFMLAALCLTFLAGTAGAEEKISGRVKSIDLETNAVVVTTYEGQEVTITISPEDTSTLNKLKEKRVRADDDVKVRYVVKDGKNVATYFRKPAGC
jgi:ABC-type Fe3+-hydroxamate transport system substrate-binding protein